MSLVRGSPVVLFFTGLVPGADSVSHLGRLPALRLLITTVAKRLTLGGGVQTAGLFAMAAH
jgi:hypothetical protein